MSINIRSQLQSSIIFTYDMRIIVFSVKVNGKLYCHGISVSYIEVLVHNNVAVSHSCTPSPRVSSYYINSAREPDEIKLKTRTFHTLSVPLYDCVLLLLSSSLSVSSSSSTSVFWCKIWIHNAWMRKTWIKNVTKSPHRYSMWKMYGHFCNLKYVQWQLVDILFIKQHERWQ